MALDSLFNWYNLFHSFDCLFYFYKAIIQIVNKDHGSIVKDRFDPLTQFLIADIFYLIPLDWSDNLGSFLSLYYLYTSFREGLRLSSMSSIMLMMFPFVLISFFAVFLLLLGVIVFI